MLQNFALIFEGVKLTYLSIICREHSQQRPKNPIYFVWEVYLSYKTSFQSSYAAKHHKQLFKSLKLFGIVNWTVFSEAERNRFHSLAAVLETIQGPQL